MPSPVDPQPTASIHADDPRATALMAAIRTARRERMSQDELAKKLNLTQNYVSRWETTRPPRPAQVAEIEAALGLPAGTLLRQAGYVEDDVDIESAILSDPLLTPDYQQIVLNTYRMAVRNSAEARAARARTQELARRQSPKTVTAGSSKPSATKPKPVRASRKN